MIYEVNWLAVIIAAVGSFIIGFLWFGPIFGKKWMELMKFTPEHIEEGKKKGMMMSMIVSLISSVVTAFVYFSLASALLLSGYGELLMLSVLFWIAFVLPPILNGSLWEGKSWSLFWMTSIQILVSLVFMALVFVWMVV
jgi:hypothetical protein